MRCGTESLSPRYYKVGVCEYISGGKRAPRRPDPDDDYSGVRNPAPVVASSDDGEKRCAGGGCARKRAAEKADALRKLLQLSPRVRNAPVIDRRTLFIPAYRRFQTIQHTIQFSVLYFPCSCCFLSVKILLHLFLQELRCIKIINLHGMLYLGKCLCSLFLCHFASRL